MPDTKSIGLGGGSIVLQNEDGVSFAFSVGSRYLYVFYNIANFLCINIRVVLNYLSLEHFCRPNECGIQAR